MLTTVTSWLWIDIHRHIHRSIILHTRPFQIYFVLSRFFSLPSIQPPPPPPPPPPPRLSPFGWSQTIKPTLPSYTIPGGGGGVMIPTNSTNTTTTTKAMSCNKIGQSIEHANRLRKSTWQTKENSVNSVFGEGTRRCFSFVNSSGPTQTGCRRSTLNPDGGWTISTVREPSHYYGWSRSLHLAAL